MPSTISSHAELGEQCVDLQTWAWHSRRMRHRRSIRQLLLTIALSHVLAIQGLLLAASGSLALADASGEGASFICSGAASANDNADGTAPLGQTKHRDCLSACLSAPAAGEPPATGTAFTRPAHESRSHILQDMSLPVISQARAFLARAPPALI